MTANGSAADALVEQAGASPGDRVRVRRGERSYEGVLMPRHGFSGEDVLVLKLDSGYNLGLALEEGDAVEILEDQARGPSIEPEPPEGLDELPDVALLGTGGTIASFVEYRTGAVYPATSPEELAAAVPEAFEHANLRPDVVFEAFSEDLSPDHWEQLADAVEQAFGDGARGVVVTHGTDTMHFTQTALSLLFDELPGPVVLVGAQRSSDRPSSDAATNLVQAVRLAAQADAGEVLLCMHGGMSDEVWHVHGAGRARKMHTSRRDAFQSLNAPPVAELTGDELVWRTDPIPPGEEARRVGRFSRDVGLVHGYPSLTEDELRAGAGDGLVIAGTGLGHIPRRLIPTVAEIVEDGTLVAVASQCLNGRTNLRVYETGRELIHAGCLEAGDLLPEAAFVKLAWAVGTAQARDEQALTRLQGRTGDRALEEALDAGNEMGVAKALFQLPLGREASARSPFHYPGGGS